MLLQKKIENEVGHVSILPIEDEQSKVIEQAAEDESWKNFPFNQIKSSDKKMYWIP